MIFITVCLHVYTILNIYFPTRVKRTSKWDLSINRILKLKWLFQSTDDWNIKLFGKSGRLLDGRWWDLDMNGATSFIYSIFVGPSFSSHIFSQICHFLFDSSLISADKSAHVRASCPTDWTIYRIFCICMASRLERMFNRIINKFWQKKI